jgi:hypothetical protein
MSMTKNEIEQIAEAMEIPDWRYLGTETRLVRAIQKARGDEDCYLTDKRIKCWAACDWRSSCFRLVAEWRR